MFGTKTVDSVIAAFTKAIDDLNVLAQNHENVCAEQKQKARIAATAADFHAAQAERAVSVARKIAALVE